MFISRDINFCPNFNGKTESLYRLCDMRSRDVDISLISGEETKLVYRHRDLRSRDIF